MTLSGIDVSNYQHQAGRAIDWAKVRSSGIEAAYVLATEGSSFTNPYLAQDVKEARAAGVAVGAYHFALPAVPVALQVALFHAQTNGLSLNLPPALDLEQTGGLGPQALADWAWSWLSAFPGSICYFPRSLGASLTPFGFPFGHRPWIAVPGATIKPSPPTSLQYSWSGTIQGIVGGVDLDWYDDSLLKEAEAEVKPGYICAYQNAQWLIVPSATLGFVRLPIADAQSLAGFESVGFVSIGLSENQMARIPAAPTPTP